MILQITLFQKEISLYKKRECITENVPSAIFRIWWRSVTLMHQVSTAIPQLYYTSNPVSSSYMWEEEILERNFILYKESNKMHFSYVFILKFALYIFRTDTPSSGVYVSPYMQLFVHIMLTVTNCLALSVGTDEAEQHIIILQLTVVYSVPCKCKWISAPKTFLDIAHCYDYFPSICLYSNWGAGTA